MELFIYSTKGEFRFREKLTDLLNLEQINAGVVYGFTDKDGDLWICVRNKGALFRIQPDGRQSMKISIPQNYPFGFMRGKQADELIAALQSGDGLVLRIMNTRTGKSEDYPIREFPGGREYQCKKRVTHGETLFD